MLKKLKFWILRIFRKNTTIIGVDVAKNGDFGCVTKGYVDGKGVIHIVSVKYTQ